MRRSAGSRLLGAAFRLLNKVIAWHRLPALLGTFNLLALREELRERNLHDTSRTAEAGERAEAGCAPHGGRRDPRVLCARTADGSLIPMQPLPTQADGSFSGRVIVPIHGVDVGEYDVVASTPGNAHCGPGQGE